MKFVAMLLAVGADLHTGTGHRTVRADRTGPGLYAVVIDQLVSLSRGENGRMLESFSDKVRVTVVEPSGGRTSFGKAAVSTMYRSFSLLRGSAARKFACQAGAGQNICRLSLGEGATQRSFVVRYDVEGGLITGVLARELARRPAFASALVREGNSTRG